MRIAVISDVHLENHKILGGPMVAGVNRRARHIADAFGTAIRIAMRLKCDRMVICGDVFDCAKPDPEIIGLFAEEAAKAHFRIQVVPGNHDRSSDQPGHHALSALRKSTNVLVKNDPTLDGADYDDETDFRAYLLLVPFTSNLTEVVVAKLQQASTGQPIYVFLHAGIVGPDTPPFLRDGKNVLQLDDVVAWGKLGVRGVFAGDWHNHAVLRTEGPAVVQVGALCPANFGDPPCGKMVVLDTETGAFEVVAVPGPRFNTLDMTDLRPLVIDPDALHDGEGPLYLKIRCADRDRPEASSILEKLQANYPALTDWLIESEPDEQEQAVIAESMRPQATAGESVRAYCRQVESDQALADAAADLAEGFLRCV